MTVDVCLNGGPRYYPSRQGLSSTKLNHFGKHLWSSAVQKRVGLPHGDQRGSSPSHDWAISGLDRPQKRRTRAEDTRS